MTGDLRELADRPSASEHLSMHNHEHRMEQDGSGWRAVVRYGRHTREFWSSEVNREVVRLAAPAEGEVALDIGAGMGAGVFVAAGMVGDEGRVLAVEPTPFMRSSLAIRRRTNRHRRRVEVLDGVAEHLPVDTGRVDVAWAVNVLHHISHLDDAIAELRRVLAPGGRVVLVDEDFDDPAHPDHERMMKRHSSGHAHQGGDHHHETDEHGHHHLMVDIEVLGETLSAHGFVDVSARDELVAGAPAKMATARLPPDPRPSGHATITPYLTVEDSRAAIDWYSRHFDADVTFEPLEMGDGRVGHAEIRIGDSRLMLSDEFPEMGVESPPARGGPTTSFVIWVDDADRVVGEVEADGATVERPVDEQPHGARAGWVIDPFGHRWFVSTHHSDISPDEVRRRINEAIEQPPG